MTFAGIGGQFGIVCGIPQVAAPAQPAAAVPQQAAVAPAVSKPAVLEVAAQQPIVAPAIPEPAPAAIPEENVDGQAVIAEQSVAVEEENIVGEKDVVEDVIMEEETHLEDTLLPKDGVEEPVAEDRMEE